MAARPSPATPHLARIDVLRACAILLVFCHHYWMAVRQLPGPHTHSFGWARLPWAPWEFGYLGVKLFFVISGFCIHLSALGWLQRRPPESPLWRPFLADFFWRRFWRIYPPYLGALFLFYLLTYPEPFQLHSLRHLGLHVLLANNLHPSFFHNINPSFWSIAVEWQLYLIYPLYLWMTLRWRVEIATLVASAVAFALHFGAPHFTASFMLLHSPFAYWFEWVIGAWLAQYYLTGRRVFRAHSFLVPVTGTAAVFAHVFSAPDFATYLLPTLFFAVLLEATLHIRAPLSTFERYLVPLGLCSYSLYLFHQPWLASLVTALFRHLPPSPPLVAWTIIPLVLLLPLLALCWLHYRWIELPSITAGKHLRPQRN